MGVPCNSYLSYVRISCGVSEKFCAENFIYNQESPVPYTIREWNAINYLLTVNSMDRSIALLEGTRPTSLTKEYKVTIAECFFL